MATEAHLETSWVQTIGLRMHARVSRPRPSTDVPTVVLVHGLISTRYLVPAAERLAGWCRVLAPDLPGFGRTPRRPGAPTVPNLADALAAWMAASALPPAIVLGHSDGAQVAAELAVRHPELVAKVVLASPTGDPDTGLAGYAGRWLRNLPQEPLSLNAVIAREVLDSGIRPWRAFLHALRHRFVDLLPRVPVPTLVLRGAREPIAPSSWAEKVTALVPDARLATVAGAAHTYVYATPGPLDEVLRPYVLGEG